MDIEADAALDPIQDRAAAPDFYVVGVRPQAKDAQRGVS
jgi:hypothetical protein